MVYIDLRVLSFTCQVLMVDFCVLVYALDSKLSAEVFCLRRNAAG